MRNVLFEQYLDENTDWASLALAEISQSFGLNRPAVVSSHRINYVGGMDMGHRDRSLKDLDRLLSGLRQRWPDVQFITSDELAELMQDKQ